MLSSVCEYKGHKARGAILNNWTFVLTCLSVVCVDVYSYCMLSRSTEAQAFVQLLTVPEPEGKDSSVF